MRTLAVIIIALLAAAFVAPLLVSAGSRLSKQAKEYWKRK